MISYFVVGNWLVPKLEKVLVSGSICYFFSLSDYFAPSVVWFVVKFVSPGSW